MTQEVLEAELAKIDARIERGVEWLDQNTPNWLAEIRSTSLRIDSITNCVLGQMYGDYEFVAMNYSRSWAVSKAFMWPASIDDGDDAYFNLLTSAWKKKIAALRKERQVRPRRR